MVCVGINSCRPHAIEHVGQGQPLCICHSAVCFLEECLGELVGPAAPTLWCGTAVRCRVRVSYR